MNRLTRPPVVVGVGPDTSPAVVDVAAAEASLRGLPLHLLSVHPSAGAGPHDAFTASLHRVAAQWSPRLAVTARDVSGDPGTELVAASRAAALVVVGQGGDGALAMQVAAHALCPTMVVPAGPPASGGPVLLGLALQANEEAAIGYAFEAADLRRVPLTVAHVWAGLPGDALGAVNPFSYDVREAYAAADRMVAEGIAGWAGKYPDVTVERMPLYDPNPARTLLDLSTTAGLVVVGARRGDRHSEQLGGISRRLIAGASCPVVVVRLARAAYE